MSKQLRKALTWRMADGTWLIYRGWHARSKINTGFHSQSHGVGLNIAFAFFPAVILLPARQAVGLW